MVVSFISSCFLSIVTLFQSSLGGVSKQNNVRDDNSFMSRGDFQLVLDRKLFVQWSELVKYCCWALRFQCNVVCRSSTKNELDLSPSRRLLLLLVVVIVSRACLGRTGTNTHVRTLNGDTAVSLILFFALYGTRLLWSSETDTSWSLIQYNTIQYVILIEVIVNNRRPKRKWDDDWLSNSFSFATAGFEW